MPFCGRHCRSPFFQNHQNSTPHLQPTVRRPAARVYPTLRQSLYKTCSYSLHISRCESSFCRSLSGPSFQYCRMASTTSVEGSGKSEIIDDKSSHCIPFILSRLEIHRAQHPEEPFFIGLNGVQGAGKTTLVSKLQETLQEKGLETLVCSIDDFYLTHQDQVALAKEHPDNALVQHRGEPGTHDIPLAAKLFTALRTSTPTLLPSYTKSAFAGSGDRSPSTSWLPLNNASQPKIRVIIFEGWCVGFRALSFSAVSSKYTSSLSNPKSTLPKHKLEHLQFVNDKLRQYDVMTDTFDAFIHIDALETGWVYEWRQEQEAQLRREKGKEGAMSEEQVVRFVDGYYPAYELYTEGVRAGVLKDKGEEAQLRLVVGRDRRVIDVVRI